MSTRYWGLVVLVLLPLAACPGDPKPPPADLCADLVCAASDQCHAAGVCDPMTGACSNPAKANDTPCADGNACTQTDTCQAGPASAPTPRPAPPPISATRPGSATR